MNNREQLVETIVKSSDGNPKKLSCAKAFHLAQEYEAKLAEIGRICNDNNVKICKCQLGCFK
jgi:hypothetical protein